MTPGYTQYVKFELVDGEFNEVIFVGEKDIILNCSVTCVKSSEITIKHGDLEIARNITNDGYLQYHIEDVSLEHHGRYACIVSFIDISTGLNNTEMETLILNIQKSGPQCFRNGTEGKSYQEGDLLLISCYCLENDSCVWTATIEGAGTAVHLNSIFERTLHRGKEIQRLLEEYVMSTNMDVRYDCIRISGQNNFCSIGPQKISSQDMVINSVPSSDTASREKSHCDLFPTSTSDISTFQSTASQTLEASSGVLVQNYEFVIGIVTAGGIITIVILQTVIILIFVKCRKRNRTIEQIENVYSHQLYTNASYNYEVTAQDNHLYYIPTFHPVECNMSSIRMEDSSLT